MALVDNFDSYTGGDLNGQGSWSGDASFDVQSSVVQAGANAVSHATTGGVTATKTFTAEATGNQIFYVRGTDTNARRSCQIRSGATTIIQIGLASGQIQHIYGDGAGGNTSSNITAFAANTWYKIEVEWDAGTNQQRARVNDGSWTSWQNALLDATFTDCDTAGLNCYGTVNGTFYWDSLDDPNAGAASSIKSIAGVTQANIKSVAGVTNANIKSIAGVTNS